MAEEFVEIRRLTDGLPALNLPDEPAKPLGRGVVSFADLDFKALVDMRCSHQTHQAATGVRTRQSQDSADSHRDGKKTVTLKRQIIRQFHEALKESQDDKAIGTGYERSARWRAPARGGRDGQIDGTTIDALHSCNATNAAVTASALAKQVRQFFAVATVLNT